MKPLNNQTQIRELQNKDEMLKSQFVAHICFNNAEKLNYLSWALSLIGALLIIVPTGDGIIALFIPILVDVITLVFRILARKNVAWAAKLRNYFDNIVLGLDNHISDAEVSSITEKINIITGRYQKKCSNIIHNTDQSNVPGLKDWYSFPKETKSPLDAVFECQRQNFWWTEKQNHIRKIIYGLVIFLFIIVFMVGIHFYPVKTLACVLGLFVNLIDDIRENYKSQILLEKMKALIDTPNASSDQNIISQLQNYIEQRRELLAIEINFVHSKNAKKWSRLYNSTYQNHN